MGARLWDHCVRAHRSFRTAPTEAPCTPPTRDVQTQGDYEEDAWCQPGTRPGFTGSLPFRAPSSISRWKTPTASRWPLCLLSPPRNGFPHPSSGPTALQHKCKPLSSKRRGASFPGATAWAPVQAQEQKALRHGLQAVCLLVCPISF